MTEQTFAEKAKAMLEARGYIVLKEKSYRAAQERQRIAQVRMEDAQERTADAERWARDCLAEERRMRDRLTFVYGVAKAHGATTEELHGCEQCKSYADTIEEHRQALAARYGDQT